jgi:hypothetical protein
MSGERRRHARRNIQAIVHFNVRGHEKVFESHSRNLSPAGIFVEAEPAVLDLMRTGESVIALLEFRHHLFVRLTGYVVRLEFSAGETGFAMKFLELDPVQKEMLEKLLPVPFDASR